MRAQRFMQNTYCFPKAVHFSVVKSYLVRGKECKPRYAYCRVLFCCSSLIGICNNIKSMLTRDNLMFDILDPDIRDEDDL